MQQSAETTSLSLDKAGSDAIMPELAEVKTVWLQFYSRKAVSCSWSRVKSVECSNTPHEKSVFCYPRLMR